MSERDIRIGKLVFEIRFEEVYHLVASLKIHDRVVKQILNNAIIRVMLFSTQTLIWIHNI